MAQMYFCTVCILFKLIITPTEGVGIIVTLSSFFPLFLSPFSSSFKIMSLFQLTTRWRHPHGKLQQDKPTRKECVLTIYLK